MHVNVFMSLSQLRMLVEGSRSVEALLHLRELRSARDVPAASALPHLPRPGSGRGISLRLRGLRGADRHRAHLGVISLLHSERKKLKEAVRCACGARSSTRRPRKRRRRTPRRRGSGKS